jgi:hypothetical protein
VEELGTEAVLPIDFLANHFTGSLLATIYWWLDHDLPYTADEMATMFQQANQMDRNGLLGIDQTQAEADLKENQNKRKKHSKEKDQSPEGVNTPEPDPEQDEPVQGPADHTD